MIKRHVISDDGRFPYHDTSAVINKETTTDRRARMDVDIRHETSEPGQKPCRKPQVPKPEPVRDAKPYDRMHARIGDQRLKLVAGRRITRPDALQIFAQEAP